MLYSILARWNAHILAQKFFVETGLRDSCPFGIAGLGLASARPGRSRTACYRQRAGQRHLGIVSGLARQKIPCAAPKKVARHWAGHAGWCLTSGFQLARRREQSLHDTLPRAQRPDHLGAAGRPGRGAIHGVATTGAPPGPVLAFINPMNVGPVGPSSCGPTGPTRTVTIAPAVKSKLRASTCAGYQLICGGSGCYKWSMAAGPAASRFSIAITSVDI